NWKSVGDCVWGSAKHDCDSEVSPYPARLEAIFRVTLQLAIYRRGRLRSDRRYSRHDELERRWLAGISGKRLRRCVGSGKRGRSFQRWRVFLAGHGFVDLDACAY